MHTAKPWLATVGGKGSDPRAVVEELRILQSSDVDVETLGDVSRLSAKIGGVALQDDHRLYTHGVIVSQSSLWAVVQQGMNVENLLARRYHIHGVGRIKIVSDPHSGIACNRIGTALNLVDREAAKKQKYNS
jgi:hypothetical protein